MSLLDKKCIPCEGGVSPLTDSQITAYLNDTPGWATNSERTKIEKSYKFKNFVKALDFVNKVGAVAEQENHHPDIAFGWGYCNIVLQTHAIGGLHDNDFIVAAKIDALS